MNPNRKKSPTILHAIIYFWARVIFRLMGWRKLGEMPNIPKFVLIFAPHTSYSDNYMLAAVQALYRFEAIWLAAEKLFNNPLLRRFLLFSGARPVDRSKSHNLVDYYVEMFDQQDYMILGLAPEGTRKKRDYWKSGFYWIALGANVPIVCLGLDYKTRTVSIGPVIYPEGNIYEDMETIRAFYVGMEGRRIERMTAPYVSPGYDVSEYKRKAS